ncbi:hypothetical protein [Marinitoga lauensis]|nr:hypothetical protein [Marinitoga lauensis]
MDAVVMEGIYFYFNDGPKIVENFSMNISKGEFVYIKGSNGSGKVQY